MDLVATLAAHRKHLLDAYKGPQWPEVAQHYGASGATREAQLRSALESVVAWARRFPSAAAISDRLDRFTADALDEASPKTGATAGLSMIFANATANTGWWAAKYSTTTTYIADCSSCGAPQQKVLVFVCQYCGNPLYEEESE